LAFRDFRVSATFIPHSRAPARQGEIISGLHLCSSRLYKGKKLGAFQEKWLRHIKSLNCWIVEAGESVFAEATVWQAADYTDVTHLSRVETRIAQIQTNDSVGLV